MDLQVQSPASPELWGAQLESQFELIQLERMADVPVINNRLKVQAVGFRRWNGRVLGVLVTPWFMNLILLPGQDDDWREIRTGSKQSFLFDAGQFEFVTGRESGIGVYMCCSLFSPMFEFESHAAAVETAEAAIEAIFDDANIEKFTSHELEEKSEEKSYRTELLEGAQVVAEVTHKNLDQPISRRDLLRASFLRSQNSSSGD